LLNHHTNRLVLKPEASTAKVVSTDFKGKLLRVTTLTMSH
jgi:hypothetical protein